MPKKPKDEEFDMEEIEMEDGEDAFEVDGDVIERIAVALETIAKVLVDREAKFASRPPRDNNRSFGDRGAPRSFGNRDGGDGDGKFENKREFTRPGYGEKTFRNGPGVGFSDREKPARSGPPRTGGKPFGKPAGGRPTGGPKGPPKGRGKY